MQFDIPAHRIVGPAGELPVLPDDLVVCRLAMLIEGQCEGIGAAKAAEKLDLSKQRYFQLLKLYREHGSAGLQGQKPGPKRNYVRTDEVVRQVIRQRFLDPDATVDVIAQKLRQAGFQVSVRSVVRVIEEYGLQKKLYRYRPGSEQTIEARTTQKRTKPVPCDPRSIEGGVRQLLADKVVGNLAGIWLLVPELLRLGAWDLVCGWTGQSPGSVGPRLALQLIHEAALCRTGLRHRRALNQRTFELANGLPFLASDMSVHELLGARTVAESLDLQVALGKIRRASGHFRGRLLAIDPHRVRSYTERHMRPHRKDARERAVQTAQTFFVLDVDTDQPVCFTTGTSARTAASAAEELLKLAGEILNPEAGASLVLADTEHFSVELMDRVKAGTRFDLLVPMHNRPALLARLAALPPELFRPRWAGYATAKLEYTPRDSQAGPFHQYVQRQGERPQEYRFNAFLATRDGDEVEELAGDFPKRWHVEEFFNAHQALGWDRAGTCNLNIRYGQMTMALIAQAAIAQIRKRLAPPATNWDARHMATAYFEGLEGDVRVDGDTIIVTYYNARDADRLRDHYEDSPAKLRAEKIDPRVPWLYGFMVDYRFR